MQDRTVRLLQLGLVGVPLAVATVLALLWPGPLALDDRIPLALLFGIPTVLVASRARRVLESRRA